MVSSRHAVQGIGGVEVLDENCSSSCGDCWLTGRAGRGKLRAWRENFENCTISITDICKRVEI
jgi:hypothetical protein